MTPPRSQSSFLARSLKEFLEFHHVLSGPNVAKSHGQEFFSTISIALNRGLINHQETPGLIVMDPGSQRDVIQRKPTMRPAETYCLLHMLLLSPRSLQ